MIGMTTFARWRDHDPRLEPPDRPRDELARCEIVHDAAVRQLEILALLHAHYLGRLRRLGRPYLGGPARAQLSLGHVHDRGLVTLLRRLDQRAGAGELDVVAMGGDGEKVYLRHSENVSGDG